MSKDELINKLDDYFAKIREIVSSTDSEGHKRDLDASIDSMHDLAVKARKEIKVFKKGSKNEG
jgi:hypothetical protein